MTAAFITILVLAGIGCLAWVIHDMKRGDDE